LNASGTFHLSPSALAITALQACEIANSSSPGDSFKYGDIAKDFEVHRIIMPATCDARLSRITSALNGARLHARPFERAVKGQWLPVGFMTMTNRHDVN